MRCGHAAAIAYEVLAGTPLLPCGFDLADYNARTAALQQVCDLTTCWRCLLALPLLHPDRTP